MNRIYRLLPLFLQNLLIVLYDLKYFRRRGGQYKRQKRYYNNMQFASREILENEQNKRLRRFLGYVRKNSKFYARLYENIDVDQIRSMEDLSRLPSVTKEDIRLNFDDIVTISNINACTIHTGGTTGKSLKVYYKWSDVQDRYAVLDSFRESHGYKLGLKTAWFSGKSILSERDLKQKRFWKTNFIFHIRYYSTFHLSADNVVYYIKNLNEFKPKIISGFPSNIYEIAKLSIVKNYPIMFSPNAIFTTAETLTPEYRNMIEKVFKCRIFDQYASSEGAPFIFECECGNMHYQMLSGVIEVVDENDQPSDEGEMIVTAFATHGTPLIRYRVGDRIKLAPLSRFCQCGCQFPIVETIYGRSIDHIFSRERGKINLGNISNCIKKIDSIIHFQIIQYIEDEIDVLIETDSEKYSLTDEHVFKKELYDRLGQNMKINIRYVDSIPKAKSGKYQIVINKLPKIDT